VATLETRTELREKILVFSPDKDLAGSLSMLLEGNFEIVCETRLDLLRELIDAARPALLLIDLFSYPRDISKVLNVLTKHGNTIPSIILHVFQQHNPQIEADIRKSADLVLYKPLDVEEIGKSITQLLTRKGRSEETP